MAGFGLRKNTVFNWDGTTFRIERLQPNGDVLLEATSSGALSIVARTKLLDSFAQGLISTGIGTCSKSPTSTVYAKPLQHLPETVTRELKRRKRYLEAVIAEGQPLFTATYLDPLLKQVAMELQDPNPPSAITFYRWHRRWKRQGDTRALIPRYDLRGKSISQNSSNILHLLSEATTDAFKATPLATGRNIYSRLLEKIDRENRKSLASTPLVAPSLRTIHRLLADTDRYEMSLLKQGKVATEKQFRIGKAGVRTSRILERVEIDHTPLDLFLVDERTGLPLGRPTLTMAIDHFSRMPHGYYLSFGGPSAAAVVGALRHAILPKSAPEITIPGLQIENLWPTYGIPETLVADNGLEFHGFDLEGVAFDLGISLVFCPKRQPRFKGVVERYLKTINYDFAHQLPGTSFARFHLRGDYDPQKAALLTLSEFKHLFEKWLMDVYAQTKHSSINTTPWVRWHEGMALHEPQLPENLQLLQQRIGQSASRKLRRDGFELNGIRYNGEILAPVLRRYGEGVEVRVVFDPEDLGTVYVWGPDDSSPHQVQATDLSYAHGMTLQQNKLIRQAMKEAGASSSDRFAVQRARSEMQRAVEELMTHRKQTARQRSARFQGISSRKPHGTSMATKAVDRLQERKEEKPEAAAMPELLPAFQLGRPAR